MDEEDKIRFIEEVFSFSLDAPFSETANAFPSPIDVIEDWFLSATIFRNVREKQKIAAEHYEALHTLIMEAEAEYRASEMLGEAPDTGEELGFGYDDDEVPEGFAPKHQAAIWTEVMDVLSKDQRPKEWTLESE